MRKKVKEMIETIEADGWFFIRQKEVTSNTGIQPKREL
jgi:hypothetical protein